MEDAAAPSSLSPLTARGKATQQTETDDSATLSPPTRVNVYTPPPQMEGEGKPTDGQTDAMPATLNRNSVADLSICASPADVSDTIFKSRKTDEAMHRRSESGVTKEGAESLAAMLRTSIEQHQIGLSVNLILFVALSWLLFPSLRSRLAAFMSLSYGVNHSSTLSNSLFGLGPRDLHLVLSFVVVFTGLRAFMLDYVLSPLASVMGIRRRKAKVRFAEQAYLLFYYSVYWCWGVWLFIRDTPGALPTSGSSTERLLVSLWTGFPKLYLDGAMKLYYLSQLAFWVQQILVIHLEERRKDHYQMLTHHFFTVALLVTSYGFRQCRVGNAVLVVMDIVDLIFPLAKILRYIGWQKACDAAFALFVVVWLAARHGAYLTICWSIYAHINAKTMYYGTYSLKATADGTSGIMLTNDGGRGVWQNVFQPFLRPGAHEIRWNARTRWGFLALLLGLQVLTLMWFVMICRVVARVLRGEGADDSRSDDEGEDEEKESGSRQASVPFPSPTEENPKFIEVEASAADLSYHAQPPRTGSGSKRKGKGISSGLNLGERKDILNRIGCLSEEQLAREREKREGSEGSRPSSSAGTKR